MVEQVNKTEKIITFKNPDPYTRYYPAIHVVGFNDEDGDRVRGLRIFFCAGDEWQDVKPGILDNVILPAMADTPGSYGLFSGTPKGKRGNLAETARRQEKDPTWGTYRKKSIDNPHIPPEEIERLRVTLTPRAFRQELEASEEDFPGKIYDCFQELTHVTADIPAAFPVVILGIDWGDIHPALVVVGRTESGVYYTLDEFHNEHEESPVLEDDLWERAIALCLRYNVTHSYADPSRPAAIAKWRAPTRDALDRFKIRHGDGFSYPKGLRVLSEGSRYRDRDGKIKAFSVAEGNDMINALYHQNRAFIRAGLTHLIDTENSYHRRQDRDGNILDEVAPGQDDHLQDAKRYGIATYERRGRLRRSL